MEQQKSMGATDVLQLRDFRWLWLGQIVSNFGDALTHLTLILWINRLTDGSTMAIAWLLISLALPQALLGLVAGVFVDRWDRKWTMIISDLLRGVLVLGIILLPIEKGAPLWPLYLLVFVHSTVGAFFAPARSALIPRIVPGEGLLAANSLSQMSMVFFRLLGTAAAGFLVGALDTFWIAFTLDGVTFFLSALFIARVGVAGASRLATTPAAQGWRRAAAEIVDELRAGLALIGQSRALAGTLLAAAITMLGLGALNVLLAPFLVNELRVSETWFGGVELAQTAAMILSGSVMALLAARFRPTSIISGSLIWLGLAATLLALVSRVWHLLPILFAVGLAVTPLNAAIATLVQTEVADEARGRISASLGALIQVASLVSMFAAGTVATLVGTRNLFVLCGIIVVLGGVVAIWMFRGYLPPSLPGDKLPLAQPAGGD